MAKRLVSIDTKEIEMLEKLLCGSALKEVQALLKRLKVASKRIKVASAKNKGRKLQQETCEMVSRITGIPYVSGEDGLIESRGGGQSGTDVALRGSARELFPFSVECKATETFNLMDTIQQAKENTYEGTDWLIVHDRKKMSEPVVILGMAAFEKLCRKEK